MIQPTAAASTSDAQVDLPAPDEEEIRIWVGPVSFNPPKAWKVRPDEAGEATALIRATVDVGPLQQYVPVAQAVVLACVVGVEDDDLGEPKGEATDDRPSPMAASGSPASMAPEPSSD